MPDVRCIFRRKLQSTDIGTNMCQPPAQARPDAIKRRHADEELGVAFSCFPLDIRVVTQRNFDFVNHCIHLMAEEPDGGLVHETPVDPAVQLKALVEHVKLHNHITQGGQSRDAESRRRK